MLKAQHNTLAVGMMHSNVAWHGWCSQLCVEPNDMSTSLWTLRLALSSFLPVAVFLSKDDALLPVIIVNVAWLCW